MRETRGRGARRSLPGFFVAAAFCATLSCAGTAGGSSEDPENGAEGAVIPDTSIIAAQEELTPTVMALPGVVGTAVGLCDDALCIKVYLAREDEELRDRIPETFRGFTVDVEVSGEFEARNGRS